MRKIFVLCAALLLASTAWGAYRTLTVTGNTVFGTTAADTMTVNATLSFQAATSFPGGTAALPSINFTGSLTTGFYEVAADSPGVSVATANVGTWDAAGYQGDLGQTTAGAADVTTLTTTGLTDLFAGAVGAPSLSFTGSATSGLYEIGADNIGMAIGGALVGDFDAAGLNNCPLGITTAAAADVTTLTTTGQVDLQVGAVGAPSIAFTGSLTTGYYQTAADEMGIAVAGANVGTWDGTGLIADGLNAPIGTVTPAAGTFTDVDVGGTFNFGQDPADLVGGYKEISDYITCICTFDHGSDVHLAVFWDIAQVVGAGTNTVSGVDGWNQLITGGAGGPDMESTRSNGLNHNATYAPRVEIVVELATIAAGQTFFFGYWAAANRYCEIIHEPATSANWLLRIDDTAGAETEDSGVAATVNPTKLALWTDAAGNPDWAINDVDMATVGITNLMANDHYLEWRILDVAAAPHTVQVDYLVNEQLKQQ